MYCHSNLLIYAEVSENKFSNLKCRIFGLFQTVVDHQRLDIHILVLLQQHIRVLRQSPVRQDMMEQRVLQLLHVKILEAGQLFQDV